MYRFTTCGSGCQALRPVLKSLPNPMPLIRAVVNVLLCIPLDPAEVIDKIHSVDTGMPDLCTCNCSSVKSMQNESKVICVIMGGGRGTRLHPLTQQRCKPAVPLAGKYRLVDIPISNCINSGLNRIHVLTQFNTASLHNHIQKAYQFDAFGGGHVDILSAEQTEGGESWYQGTADAVRQNLHHFSFRDDDLFLILSGDQLYRMDFRKVLARHRDLDADVTISAMPVPASAVSELGVMRVGDDYLIDEFVEKPKDPAVVKSLLVSDQLRSQIPAFAEGDYCLASMGIYVFKAAVMREALQGDETDFGREIIPGLLGRRKLAAYLFSGYWEDIGTVGAFFEANLALADAVPPFNFFDAHRPIYTRPRYLPASKFNASRLERVIAADGCIVGRSSLLRCVVGVRCMIGDDCTLENTVIMGSDFFESGSDRRENVELRRPALGIGNNCVIKNAIIDKNARIGNDVHLSPEGKPDLWRQGDLFVRDGVMIVLKNGIIPDGTRL